MESWRRVFREGFAPEFSIAGLSALAKALRDDDPCLLQGETTAPCVPDWPVEGACATAYPGWQGDNLKTVVEVSDCFARLCFKADLAMDEPAACRWFLNWFDETPRDEMRRELLPEVNRELSRRRVENLLSGPIEKVG